MRLYTLGKEKGFTPPLLNIGIVHCSDTRDLTFS